MKDLHALARLAIAAMLITTGILANAEDLKTLDGTLYRDVTAVNTNYLPTVIITHKEGRSGVKLSNLPPEFRSKNNLPEPKSAASAQTASGKTNAADFILAQYPTSQLNVEKKVEWRSTNENLRLTYTMVLHVTPLDFEVTSYRSCWLSEKLKFDLSGKLEFKLGQETLAKMVFDKFLEWEGIAATNNAQPFEKIITSFPDRGVVGPVTRTFTFQWSGNSNFQSGDDDRRASLIDSGPTIGLIGSKHEVAGFRELLNSIPELKDELAKKLQTKEAQQNLFR